MYDLLARRAIAAALANDWASALSANLEILKDEKQDVDALNRAAKAYLQMGDIKNAVACSEEVIAIDPLNPIAERCLVKCSALGAGGAIPSASFSPNNIFLEVPGKTKIVSLVNLCETVSLARLNAGEVVQMIPKMHKVTVATTDEAYIGRLPDDLAIRIIYFYRNGNEYEACIKSVSEAEVKVFIKETKRSETLAHLPSFPMR